MKFEPCSDRVLVKKHGAEHQRESGIWILGAPEVDVNEGEVVAIGPGRIQKNGQRAALAVKVGDRVVWKRYAGFEVKIEGEAYSIMREGDVSGKVEGKDDAA